MRTGSRQRMVQSTALLFSQFGFSGTGFSDVLGHSGAPRGSIHDYFPGGKTQLAREAVDYAASVVAASAAGEGDPLGVLRTFVTGWRRTLRSSDFRAGCPVLAVAVEAHAGPELADAAAAAFARWEDLLAAAMRRSGIPRGRASRLATLSVAAIEGAIVLCRARRDTSPLDRVERELCGEIESALEAPLP
jgi:AcrR family transcriptional regulator